MSAPDCFEMSLWCRRRETVENTRIKNTEIPEFKETEIQKNAG